MTSEKKRLIFFDCVAHFGGSNQSTLQTITEVQNHCEIVVVDAYGVASEYHEAMDGLGIDSRTILRNPRYAHIGGSNPIRRAIRILASGLEMRSLVKGLKRVLEEVDPDLVWTNSDKGLFFLSRTNTGRIPKVYFARGQGVFPRWYTRRAWRQLAMVIANSESGLSRLRKSTFGDLRMAVVPNGIDTESTMAAAAVNPVNLPKASGLRVAFPASLIEAKGQSTAILGLAEYVGQGGDASLWLCGDAGVDERGDYEETLRLLALRQGVSNRVVFLGWRKDILAVLRRADVIALTSTREGMPRAILEAMALRRPVIATRVGGIPEVVRDGVDGFLIEPGDSGGFAAALELLASPVLRMQMGQAGFERVRSNFDIRTNANRFLEAVGEVW